MVTAICWKCAEDFHLKKVIRDRHEIHTCAQCGEDGNEAITVEDLGQLMEPIMREHFVPGESVLRFGENDNDWWEQDGDPMSHVVQEVLGQYFEFEDEIVDAVCAADDYDPGDGGEAYWDRSSLYEESRVQVAHYFSKWRYTLDELKHSRRFFSPAASSLFAELFEDVDQQRAWSRRRNASVVRTIPAGTRLFRARVCNSRGLLKQLLEDPFKHAGPPPVEAARAGRMNADGVVVLYGAMDAETALAEMRPALGGELALIEMETTAPLRILDFVRLEDARGDKALSYFQPDFTSQVERREFVRRVHDLISRPIVPGHEADYLITQTMAEYLAHVHKKPFDGVLFASAQRQGGRNVVVFRERDVLSDDLGRLFRVRYVAESFKLMSTSSIRYKHKELTVYKRMDGEPFVSDGNEFEWDEL